MAGVTGGSAGWWGEENGSPHLACRLVSGRGRLFAWTGDNEIWSIVVRGRLHMSLFTSNRTCTERIGRFSVVRVFVRRPETCRAKLFTKHPLSSAEPQPHHETPPASRKHRCRLCLFISTLLASPSKHPKIAQSGAAVGLIPRAPSLFNTSVCQSKWFANLASRRPGQRGRFERSQPINQVTYSWTPAHGSRRVGQAAAANVWSNSLRAGVSCAWQKEPLYIGNREVVNVVL